MGVTFLRRIGALLTAFATLFLLRQPGYAISTHATCAILMDAESGRVLYEQNIHQPRLIASTTKLMTALVAVEQSDDLDREVAVKGEWLGSEGSSIYLTAGEKITLRGLLYGLMLQSGNDAAMVIACDVAGSEADFVALMNKKAAQLGMKNTSFANPSGLNHDDHYSTAYDMALLAQACLDNQEVAAICATKSITVGNRTFVNHNKLLHRYDGCVGMKTGYTEKAGRTLVSAATRNGQTLICVTLNDGNDWNDHTKLLDFGFDYYPRQVLCAPGESFGAVLVTGSLLPCVPATAAEEVGYPLGSGESLSMEVEMVDLAASPVAVGMPLGEAVWRLNGKPVARVPLVSAVYVGRDLRDPQNFWERLRGFFGREEIVQSGGRLI